jgi:hypothetical protein
MSAFQVLNELSQLFQDSFATLLKDGQQSTLWVGSTAETETAIAGFQSLIPLPYCVHPETVRAFLEQDVLTIRFPKPGEIQ